MSEHTASPTKRASESATEMIQAVLPNDANPLGFMLGGAVMHLIDIAGAITCLKHTRQRVVTAAVDGLQFLHPIRVGDLVILKARVTCTFTTSIEVEVQVFSEEALTGVRKLTCHAYLTFVAVDEQGNPVQVPPLLLETDEARCRAEEARARRGERLRAKQALLAREAEMLMPST
ncbi:MAG: acyl-CoA thioesterase [Luteitalea sp.]|nr:acyl-CoA thioesterase [Luteitalea sp.]